MKVVFLLTQSLDNPSGLGRYGPLARELASLGYEIELFALHPAYKTLQQTSFTDSGVQVRYVGQMHIGQEGSRKIYYGPVRLMTVSLAATVRLAQATANSQAEIIQLCKAQPFNTLAARLARRGRPIYCDSDDYEAETNRFGGAWQQRLVRHFEDGVAGYCAGISTNTRFTSNRYQQMGFPAERIILVPNGVERSRFEVRPDVEQLREQLGLEPSDQVIGYVGTLGLQSHPLDLLLSAFREVLNQASNARLLLVGGGHDYDRLQNMTKELGIAPQTIFTGRVQPPDAPAYFALSTVTVDPVHDDLIAKARSPLKVVESLAIGTPVVTGDVGDRREMLHDGRLGILVEPGSSMALAGGILDLLGDDRKRQEMANAALEQREELYWDRLVHHFVKVYNK
jgi:glycosyltransferase involved in cell wall biosynthesis